MTFAPCKRWCQSGKGSKSTHAHFLLDNRPKIRWPTRCLRGFFTVTSNSSVHWKITVQANAFFKTKMLTKCSIMLALCSMLSASIMPKIMPAESAKAYSLIHSTDVLHHRTRRTGVWSNSSLVPRLFSLLAEGRVW